MGRQLTSQPGVFHLPTEMSFRRQLYRGCRGGVPDHTHCHHFVGPEPGVTERLFAHRQVFEGRTHPSRMLEVHPRQNPARRSLENFDRRGRLHELRNDLYRARACPDDCNPLTAEIVAMVPSSAVDLLSTVRVNTPNIGEAGVGKWSTGHHN